ncbi:mitochondrial aspartate-glutamate transporter agc1 [Entomophthora muscae]|uniref:Mitochondrial aspartate-glutamate transporter agc1 n=1 Tax=Entomophthora muscae TaxID=34485 RepID=A0ACC2SHL6_9FUNG|nr:mitochondrial aspartate-glutamate transporter agc1 [Entomophthora muscae]
MDQKIAASQMADDSFENDSNMAAQSNPSSSLATKLVNGAIAGVVGTLVIFPIDMVKTRLQNQRVGKNGQLPYSGGIDCFRKIVAKEGFKGLYRGLVPNLIGVTPEKAIKLAVNDLAREKLARRLNVPSDKLPTAYGMVINKLFL